MPIYSSSYKKMTKPHGKYMPTFKMKGLNTSSAPLTKKSTNNMTKKSSKSFRGKATLRRATRGGAATNYKSAVKKVTSGRPGSGKTFSYSSKGIDKRVMQISPAQHSGMSTRMGTVVAETPIRQNKKPVSNGPKGIAAYRKSIRKSMGYSS